MMIKIRDAWLWNRSAPTPVDRLDGRNGAGYRLDDLIDPDTIDDTPTDDTPRIIVTGSPDHDALAVVRVALTKAWQEIGRPITVVHGANGWDARTVGTGIHTVRTLRGADRWAHEWVLEHEVCGIRVEPHPADSFRGQLAGPERDRRMVRRGAVMLLAFPVAGASSGASGCMRVACQAGIPVVVHTHRRRAAA